MKFNMVMATILYFNTKHTNRLPTEKGSYNFTGMG